MGLFRNKELEEQELKWDEERASLYHLLSHFIDASNYNITLDGSKNSYELLEIVAKDSKQSLKNTENKLKEAIKENINLKKKINELKNLQKLEELSGQLRDESMEARYKETIEALEEENKELNNIINNDIVKQTVKTDKDFLERENKILEDENNTLKEKISSLETANSILTANSISHYEKANLSVMSLAGSLEKVATSVANNSNPKIVLANAEILGDEK